MVDPNARLVLYRGAQEGLANVRKYAAATRVELRLVVSHPYLILTLRDDGCGFDPKAVRPVSGGTTTGLGLALLQAILRVAAGGNYLDPELSESLFQLLIDPSCAADADGVAAKGGYSSLTPREQEIFRLLAEGFRPEQIAARLFISRKTAENHRFRLMQKLGFTSITELVSYADELGVI